MNILLYLLIALCSYLIGCSNMALYLSRGKGVDMRSAGSGNLGASNALVLMGWKAAVIVGIHDIGKAIVAVLLARWLFPQLNAAGAAAGAACVLGHIFPFYLRFKGGKGFASFLGMTIALHWRFAILVLVAVVVVTLISDYIVLGTVTATVIVPTYMGFATHSLLVAAILSLASVTILLKHRKNYVRILSGTEIGLRRANRGDDRAIK